MQPIYLAIYVSCIVVCVQKQALHDQLFVYYMTPSLEYFLKNFLDKVLSGNSGLAETLNC